MSPHGTLYWAPVVLKGAVVVYWAPVVLKGAVVVQGVAEIVFLLVALGPTSWKTITWATDQWATKFVFRDVVLAKKLSRGPWSDFV